jgi:GTP1/Obg family GTP-binding protein
MAKAIAEFLEDAAPVLAKQAEDAEQRERERRAQAEREERRRETRERAEARRRARQAAKEELRSIVKAWNDAFALEAFFTELSRRAATLDGEERANLEARIQTARELMGGQDPIDRFLSWSVPSESKPDDEHDEPDDED